MQDPDVGPYFLHPDSIAFLRYVFDVACDTLRDHVTYTSKRECMGGRICYCGHGTRGSCRSCSTSSGVQALH
jgi:hypothetical protein